MDTSEESYSFEDILKIIDESSVSGDFFHISQIIRSIETSKLDDFSWDVLPALFNAFNLDSHCILFDSLVYVVENSSPREVLFILLDESIFELCAKNIKLLFANLKLISTSLHKISGNLVRTEFTQTLFTKCIISMTNTMNKISENESQNSNELKSHSSKLEWLFSQDSLAEIPLSNSQLIVLATTTSPLIKIYVTVIAITLFLFSIPQFSVTKQFFQFGLHNLPKLIAPLLYMMGYPLSHLKIVKNFDKCGFYLFNRLSLVHLLPRVVLFDRERFSYHILTILEENLLNSNETEENAKILSLGLSYYLHLLFVQYVLLQPIPLCFSRFYITERIFEFAEYFLAFKGDHVPIKGIELLEYALNQIKCPNMANCDFNINSKLCLQLANVMMYCEDKKSREKSVKIFETIFSQYPPEMKFNFFRYVHRYLKNTSFFGYFTTVLKDEINCNLTINNKRCEFPENSMFLGNYLRTLLIEYISLDHLNNPNQLLESFDIIMRRLNLVRYLITKDKRSDNITNVWDLLPRLRLFTNNLSTVIENTLVDCQKDTAYCESDVETSKRSNKEFDLSRIQQMYTQILMMKSVNEIVMDLLAHNETLI